MSYYKKCYIIWPCGSSRNLLNRIIKIKMNDGGLVKVYIVWVGLRVWGSFANPGGSTSSLSRIA